MDAIFIGYNPVTQINYPAYHRPRRTGRIKKRIAGIKQIGFHFPVIHSHRILQYRLIKQHLYLIILFRFYLAPDSILVRFTGFHFDKRRHIPLHIVKTSLKSECFANIRWFEHGICLVKLIAGCMKGVIYCFTNMIEVQFAVFKELAFFLLVSQIRAGGQFNRITPEGFLHTGTIVYLFTLCMNPFVQKKVGYISQ